MKDLVFYLNAAGLCGGFVGAVGLALLTRGFIRINADGTQSWGTPPGKTNEEWQRSNRRLRRVQRIGIPLSYIGLGGGFFLQLIALWFSRSL